MSLVIPGYAFDGKRYYKLPASGRLPPAVASSVSPALNLGGGASQQKKTSKKRRKLDVEGRWSSSDFRGKGREGAIECHPATGYGRVKLQLTSRAMAHSMNETVSVYPDCVPIEESIHHIAFDELDPERVRIGGSSGSIATGPLPIPRSARRKKKPSESFYPSDDELWRTSWFLPSRVTSLHTCGSRILATCIGPPAQALVGTTEDNISLASVTLVPRKTSLWTSALTSSLVALGCDKKVLISTDPSRHTMEGYETGGKSGGGAVFALDLTENLIFAGTRKGDVKIFDQRSSRSTPVSTDEGQTRPEIKFSTSTSVTYLKRLSSGLVVSNLDGSLATYDLRFPIPKPSLALKGHVNQWELGLGVDIWNDEFLIAAGQDRRIRLWSLYTGSLLSPPSPSSYSPTYASPDLPNLTSINPFTTEFSEPVKALRFGPSPLNKGNRTRNDDGSVNRERLDMAISDADGLRRAKIGLWVGDGAALRGFEIGGMGVRQL